MMSPSPQTIDELQYALDRLREENLAYRESVAEITANIERNDHDIHAFERVMARLTGSVLNPSTTVPDAQEIPTPEMKPLQPWEQRQPQLLPSSRSNSWARKLQGLTQIEALSRIAEEQDGVVRVPEAKQILLDSGLAKGKVKNVSGHIYHTLARSGRFQRIEPGVFRLLPLSALGEESELDFDEADGSEQYERASAAVIPLGAGAEANGRVEVTMGSA